MKVITVGTSVITRTLISSFRREGVEVSACVGRNAEKNEAFCRENGVSRHYESYQLALEKEDAQFVYIALPNNLHYSYAKEALESGKNVILEKPFTASFQQAQQLRDIALSRHLYLFEAMVSVHLPVYEDIRNHLDELGTIRHVQMSMTKYSSKYDDYLAGKETSAFDPSCAGGALMDLNVYNLNVLVYLFSLPKSADYFAHVENGVDIGGSVVARYDGFVAVASSYKNCDAENYFDIAGEKGHFFHHGLTSIPDQYTRNIRQKKKGEGYGRPDQSNDEVVECRKVNPYDNEVAFFRDTYENDDYQAMESGLDHTLKMMKLLQDLRGKGHYEGE